MTSDQINSLKYMTQTNIQKTVSGRMPRLLLASGVFLIVSSVFSSSSDISPGLLGNITTFSSYLLFLIIYVLAYQKLEFPKYPMIAFGIIYVVFVIGFVRDIGGLILHPSAYTYPASNAQLVIGTGDFIGYIIASFTLVFFTPKIVNRNQFFKIMVLISTGSILVGLPAYFIGDYSFIGIDINTYTALEPFRYYDIHIPALASIWGDANAMSKIAVAGLIGSHYLYARRRSVLRLMIVLLNAFGLFFANSKMSIFAVIVAYSVYLVYENFGKRVTFVCLSISGVVGILFFALIVLGIGTNSFVPQSGFSGRIALWKASVFTFAQHPFIGIGIHNVGETISAYTSVSALAPQNSYLRIFVAGGIVGGLAYLWIVVASASRYMQVIDTKKDVLIMCLFIAFVLIQLTDTADPFGINKNALVFGTALGYIIEQAYS